MKAISETLRLLHKPSNRNKTNIAHNINIINHNLWVSMQKYFLIKCNKNSFPLQLQWLVTPRISKIISSRKMQEGSSSNNKYSRIYKSIPKVGLDSCFLQFQLRVMALLQKLLDPWVLLSSSLWSEVRISTQQTTPQT